MLYKLEQVQSFKEKPKYIGDLGSYNILPTPNIRVPLKEFYRYFSIYSPTHIDFRQIRLGSSNSLYNTKIFYFQDVAFALVDVHEDAPIALKIGCNHKWELVSQHGTFKTYKCPLCNSSNTVDTSG